MPIKVKDHGKCKEWEQRRRDRLNDAFKNLAQLLPHYDPAKIPAKIEILDKSTEFVKELRLSNSRLLSSQAENDEKCKLIKELQDEVNKLILRVKQLTILLKKASISIPTGPEIKSLGSKKQKWSGKLKLEDVENSVINSNESTTKAGTHSSQKDCLAKEGAVSIPNDATHTSTPNSVPVTSSLVTSNILGINPNPGGRSQGPPIIIPLKETNSIKVGSTTTSTSSTTSPEATPVISTSPLILSSPQKTATLLTVSSSSSPTKLISSEPIFTTTSPTQIQLPLQTFILAPCPISGATTAYPTAPQSQFLTRIALHTPLLPKPLDGISFQKIPIKSVLKPIPKIIRRRRKRTKKVKEPQLKLTAKTVNPTKDAKAPGPASHLEEPSNKSKDGAAPTKEVEEICDHSDSIPIDKIPQVVEKGGKSQAELSSEKDTGNVSTQEKVENRKASSGEMLAEATVGPSNVLETPKLAKNTVKETPNHRLTTDVETVMESSDNIPVLRIIEAGSSSEESGAGLAGLLCNVISTDESTENGENVEQITKEAMDNGPHPDTETTLSKTESITKGGLESSDITTVQNKGVVVHQLAGNSKDMETSPNFPQEIVEAGAPVPVPSVSTEKCGIQSTEQLQPDFTRKGIRRTGEKVTSLLEKCSEPNNVEVEISICVAKSADDSNSRIVKPHEPEVMKAVNTSKITTGSAVREESLNPIVESAPTVTSVIPEPIIAASLSPPKAKEVSLTNSSSTKGLPSLHQELMDTSDTVTTTDKISECIARSIDLIDANDSELMELGDHWEDTGGSPKSPISPTQMFLNMFPLLPRESTVSDHHSQPQQHSLVATPTTSHHHKSSIPPFTVSSSSRSSFFIDAMLPEDHSTSNTGSVVDEMGIVPSSHVAPCLAMTPPQYSTSSAQHISSPFSLSSNYYWTPASTSCTVDNSFDYRPTSTIIQPQHTSNSSSSSGGVPTTFTLSSSATTKSFSTFSAVTTASAPNAFFTKSTISSTAASNTTTSTPASTTANKSSSQVGKSGKSSKVSKQLPISDSNFHPLLTKASKPTTTSTVATTSVTWSLSAPTQSVSCYSHNNSSSITSVQPQSFQNPAPSSQVHFSHHGGATSSSTCSLLDSLNPMDASFFRPLINALDAHDFRTLDFTSGNPLPPPLPPLMPPVPPTPLFTTQINSNATPTSQPNVSYQAPTVSSHEPLMPTLQSSLIHHHPSSNIFGSTTQQQSAIGNNTPSSNIGVSKKQQNANSHAPPVAVQQSTALQIPPPTSTKHRSNTSGAEKTSKTSGRQKAETSKQSRSGKSSRTQPYYIPNASSSQSVRQEEHLTPEVSQLPITSQTNTHFILCRNNPSISSSSVKSIEAHLKTYDSQPQVPQYSSTNTGIHGLTSNYSTPAPINVKQLPVQQTHTQRQSSKISNPEIKSQKSKEDKAKTGSASSNTAKSKSSHQNQHQPTSTAPAIQTTNHSAASLSQQPLRTLQTSSATPLPKPATQISSKVMQNSEQIDNSSNMGQTYQFHPEPFLFPDFNGGNGSRQFGTHHHQSHYNQDVHHDQQEQSSYTQRSHPYYLPEMSSFESFAMPIQQHQSLQVAHQPNHSHTSTVGNSRQSNQSQITTKYNYTLNVQIPSSQFPIPTSESIQPPQQLPHSSTHLQSSSAQSQQHHSNVHHQETPTYNQQQHRGHLPEMQTVPQPLQNQVNIAHTHRHTQEPSRQQQPQTQHRNQPPASMAVSVPTSIASTSTSKSKQSQQPTMSQPFNRVVQPNQSNQTPQHLHQQHSQHQNQHQQLGVAAPSQQQQSNRSSSRTVNWMTDTAYRTNSSNSNTTGNAKHRQGDGGPASNPFSVSKLVGSSSTGQSKNPQIEQQHQPIQRSSNTTRGKAHASSSNGQGPPANNNMNSQNQSNYCAEALIRKNPPNDWNDWNPSFQGYSTHHPHHHPHHSSNQITPTSDNTGYGQYQYPPSTSAHSSVTSHFTHFDYPQSQQFPTSHNNLNNSQHQQGTYHSPSTQHHQIPVPHGQHVHNTQPHSSHHQPNQIQYPNQGHHQSHHHHQSHGNTSTSSVSNFNLSTIFPEINDKRGGSASANNSNHGIGANSGTSRSGGGQNSSCGYQHPGFGQQSGSGRNLHH